jgi:dihydrofolate reductase
MRPLISVYIAASLDGFIARPDGSLDWLHAAAQPDEDYGYEAFVAGVDAFAMGRGTYDHIAHIDPLPFGVKPVYVFTHRAPDARDGITFWAVDAPTAIERWTDLGFARVYVDGGVLIDAFLRAGVVDELTVTVAPVLLGEGIPLFHAGFDQRALRLVGTDAFPSGMVQLRYTIGRTQD